MDTVDYVALKEGEEAHWEVRATPGLYCVWIYYIYYIGGRETAVYLC